MSKISQSFLPSAVLFQLLFSTILSAQTLQVGKRDFIGLTGNTYGPMNTWFGGPPLTRGNRHAIIYPLQSIAAMPAGSAINALSFYRNVTSLSGADGIPGKLSGEPTLKLYLKNTPLNTLATAVNWPDSAATAVEVYNADPTAAVGDTTGWVKLNLNTPFKYTGGNLMLLIEYLQTASTMNTVVWSYDTSSVSPQIGKNYFNSTQCRYIAQVTALPFPITTTGSNIRHPTTIFHYSGATGVRDLRDQPAGFKRYPTIVQNILYLQSESEATLDIRLLDAFGKRLRRIALPAGGTAEEDLSGLPNGVYFLTTQNGRAQKIVKQ
jgi:hypothetical protein